jgi:hypothetical protein
MSQMKKCNLSTSFHSRYERQNKGDKDAPMMKSINADGTAVSIDCHTPGIHISHSEESDGSVHIAW